MSLLGDTTVKGSVEIDTLFAATVKCDELVIDSKDYVADACQELLAGSKFKPLYINNNYQFTPWFNQIVSVSQEEYNNGFVDQDHCCVQAQYYTGHEGGQVSFWAVSNTNYSLIEIGRRVQYSFEWTDAFQNQNATLGWEVYVNATTGVWSLQNTTSTMGYYDTTSQFVKLVNPGFNGYGSIFIRLNGTSKDQSISTIKGVDIEGMKYNGSNDVFRLTNGSEIYIMNDSDIELEVGCGTTQYEYADAWLTTPKGTIFGNKYVPPYSSAVLVYYAPFFYVNNGYYGGYGRGGAIPYGGWDRNE